MFSSVFLTFRTGSTCMGCMKIYVILHTYVLITSDFRENRDLPISICISVSLERILPAKMVIIRYLYVGMLIEKLW